MRDPTDISQSLIAKWIGFGLAKFPWLATLKAIRELPEKRK